MRGGPLHQFRCVSEAFVQLNKLNKKIVHYSGSLKQTSHWNKRAFLLGKAPTKNCRKWRKAQTQDLLDGPFASLEKQVSWSLWSYRTNVPLQESGTF